MVSLERAIHNLALVGFMGTGKSSVGQIVAASLRYQFVDTDERIEARAGRSISKIFEEDGETGFRKLEEAVVQELAEGRHLVIATGGGLIVNETNFERLRAHSLIVCLWASPETIWTRVRTQVHRPLLQTPDPQARIRTLLAERAPAYRRADVLIGTELRSVKDVAQHVLHQFRQALDPGASR